MKPFGSKRSFDTEPRIKSARALVRREGEELIAEFDELSEEIDEPDEGGDWTMEWWWDWKYENSPPPPDSERVGAFCAFCPCYYCKHGWPQVYGVTHAATRGGLRVCSICFSYNLCPEGPCEDNECEHRPELTGEWKHAYSYG